ncbi:MAG: ATP-dependent helicase [Lentisphaeraceae bacterium]|nr:ATP-dependent helicase [Lentisphaeraceae bacterium]
MLNHSQNQVVEHRKGALLVLAGAGTGKTRTLTHRYAAMVAEGVQPERILLLTFTRKAAAEMNERAAKLIENSGKIADLQNIGGTFHATAFRWLKRLKLSDSAFNIIDDRDCKRIVKLDLKDDDKKGLENIGMSLKDLLHLNSLCVNLQEDVHSVTQRFFPHAASASEWLNTKVEQLRKRKKDAKLLDYDDILEAWLHCLQSKQGDTIRKAYDYVMVDEYQDTSKVQVEILKELVKNHDNIMAVGDDCQSIYSFRGALSAQMRDFENDFKGAGIVKLEDNYRSSQPILDACNNIISESREVYPKELNSADDKIGPAPLLTGSRDQHQVAMQIIERVYNNLQQGIPYHKQAVIFRSSMQAMSLEKVLIQERIPYKKYGGVKLTEAAHVRDFISVISCCFTQNTAAWLRVLLLIPGIGEKTAERLVNQLDKIGSSKIPAKAEDVFLELMTLTQTEWHDEPDPVFISQAIEWYKTVIHSNYEDASTRIHDIQNLAGHLMEAKSLSDFAAELLLDQVDPDEDEDESALILSTIHSAKGKEWDCVYIINVADGAIPIRRSSVNFEEERRLLYVAMTRAKEQLFLYWPKFNSFQDNKTNELSPFLHVLNKNEAPNNSPQLTNSPETTIDDDFFDDDPIYVYDQF